MALVYPRRIYILSHIPVIPEPKNAARDINDMYLGGGGEEFIVGFKLVGHCVESIGLSR